MKIKKLISALLIGVMLSWMLPGTAAAADFRYVHGDADCDGELTIADATLVQRALVRVPRVQIDAIAADYDSDGETDIGDVTLIQRRLARMEAPSRMYRSQMNDAVQAYLKQADYTDADDDLSVMPAYILPVRRETGRPRPITLQLPQSGTLYVRDGGREITYAVQAGSFDLVNTTPGNEVTYALYGEDDSLIKAGVFFPQGQVRMINAGGNTFNIRDLGGWQCDGGRLRYGLLYRGCELDSDNYRITLSEEQKRLFTEYLGIRDDIDLRTEKEVDGEDNIIGTGDDIRSSALGESCSYVRFQVSPYSAGVNLPNEWQTACYAALIRRIADDAAQGKPCYIHCVAGADRTGTVCALIEALCGVPLSEIEKDFELTSLSPEGARLRTDASWKKLKNYLNSFPGETFRDKTVSYARMAGVTIDEINTLRSALIDGRPEKLTAS